MKRLLRRIRGIIATGVTWAFAWIGLGAGLGVLAGFPLSYLLRMALNNSVSGFLAGASFAVILSVAERNHSLRELSLRRVAVWGAAGGLLLSFLPLVFGIPLAYLLGPLLINVGIGAGMATGSVALAKRAPDRQLIGEPTDPRLSPEGH
jgi:hypothetical protein